MVDYDEIQLERRGLWRQLILSIAITLAACFILWLLDLYSLIVSMLVFDAFWVYETICRLWRSGPAIVLTSEGLDDRLLGAGLIPWPEIKRVKTSLDVPNAGTDQILIYVDHVGTYISKLLLIYRPQAYIYRKLYGEVIVLNGLLLRGGGFRAAETIREFHSLQHHSAIPARCPQCGYDLRATPNQCPECGRANAVPVNDTTP